jgi:hypothetical protein
MSDYGFKKGDGGKATPIVITKDNAIARGRFINKVEYRRTDKAEFLTIEVRDGAGNTARKSYFPPIIGKGFIKNKEDQEKEITKLNRVIKNLTTVFLGKDYETGPVSSFEGFCNKVIADLGKVYYNRELRVKLVYDKQNRPTLPTYPPTFEDPTLISDNDTKLVITQWDKVEATEVVMDTDKTPEIELKGTTDTIAEQKKDEDDLPF